MSDITINYKGAAISTMDASGTKTLLTEGKYCEDDIEVVYVKPSGVDWDGFAAGTWPTGAATLSNSVTNIAPHAFYYDAGITGISAPEVLIVEEQAISTCSNLASLYLPKVTRVGRTSNDAGGGYSIASLSKLTTLHLPELTNANGTYNMSSLGSANGYVTIVLPKIAVIGGHTFRGCKAEAIDLGPSLANLPAYNFYGGTYYNNIILRRTAGVVSADAANAINSVNSSTKVWVPSALIASYKAASNWSAKGDIFYAIEGSVYEHAYADGTPIT